MRYKKFILDSFKILDAEDHSGFFSLIPENIQWTQNNTRVIVGKGNVQTEFTKFYSSVNCSTHVFLNVWEVDDTYVITADLSVKTLTLESKEFAWTAIVNMTDGAMSKVHIFTDSVT